MKPRRGRGGFTIAEVAVSVVIVGGMMVAALQTVAAANLMQYRVGERARGQQLARMLMGEIMICAYIDPGASPLFGPESGQTRSIYDDVDDYNGFTESPPTNKDGTALSLPSASTWTRSVSVVWVDPATLVAPSTQAETGAKKITVTVQHNGVTVAKLSAIRGNAP